MENRAIRKRCTRCRERKSDVRWRQSDSLQGTVCNLCWGMMFEEATQFWEQSLLDYNPEEE